MNASSNKMIVSIGDIASTLERYAPIALQEDYDNCGLLVGAPGKECHGVLLTVDVTPEVVREAVATGCNLIVSHHPLLFKGLKKINGTTAVERSVIEAIRNDVAIYACHTCLDNAAGGVSKKMSAMLGLHDVEVLDPLGADSLTGCGAVGNLPTPIVAACFVEKVKKIFGTPVARCSEFPIERQIRRVALCGGSGAFLIDKAIASGAEAFITSDTKYHDFVDRANEILLIDIGHHESENCTKEIFFNVIKEKFPNFAVMYSQSDINPIKYL